jgi:hypothetical protein
VRLLVAGRRRRVSSRPRPPLPPPRDDVHASADQRRSPRGGRSRAGLARAARKAAPSASDDRHRARPRQRMATSHPPAREADEGRVPSSRAIRGRLAWEALPPGCLTRRGRWAGRFGGGCSSCGRTAREGPTGESTTAAASPASARGDLLAQRVAGLTGSRPVPSSNCRARCRPRWRTAWQSRCRSPPGVAELDELAEARAQAGLEADRAGRDHAHAPRRCSGRLPATARLLDCELRSGAAACAKARRSRSPGAAAAYGHHLFTGRPASTALLRGLRLTLDLVTQHHVQRVTEACDELRRSSPRRSSATSRIGRATGESKIKCSGWCSHTASPASG